MESVNTTVRAYRPGPDVALPKPSAAFMNQPGPLDLEIGCGVGMHPCRYALANPGRRLIAIEHTREKFEKFNRRYGKHGSPENLLPIHANAISWVHQFLDTTLLDRIFLLYPNPNLLNKAQRWLRMPFMGRLLDSLTVGGELHLATNIQSYAAEAREFALSQWGLKTLVARELRMKDLPLIALTNGELHPDLSGARTHFERKYLERGETCYDLIFQKVSERKFFSEGWK